MTSKDRYLSELADLQEAPVPEALKDNYKPTALPVYEAVVDLVGIKGEVKLAEVAEEVHCSRRTVERRLGEFERSFPFEVESYRGQGRGILVINYFLRNHVINSFASEFQQARHNASKAFGPERSPERFGTTTLDCMFNKNLTQPLKSDPVASPKKSSKRGNILSKLSGAPRDAKIIKGTSWFSKLMRHVRKNILWELGGGDKKTNQIICSMFAQEVDGMGLARLSKLLAALREKAKDLISDVKEKAEDCLTSGYRCARFYLRKFAGLTKEEPDLGSVRKHENFDQDRKKREEVRNKGGSGLASEVLEVSDFTVKEKNYSEKATRQRVKESKRKLSAKDPENEKEDTAQIDLMERVLENYGSSGLRRWCKRHGISYRKAKKRVSNDSPGLREKL